MKNVLKIGTLFIGMGAITASVVSCDSLWSRDNEISGKPDVKKPDTKTGKNNNANTNPAKANIKPTPAGQPIPLAGLWKPVPSNTYWKGEIVGNNLVSGTRTDLLVAQKNSEDWFWKQTKNLGVHYDIEMPQKTSFWNNQSYDIIYKAHAGYKFDDNTVKHVFQWIPQHLEQPITDLDILDNLKEGIKFGATKTINQIKYHSIDFSKVPPQPGRSIYIEVFDEQKANDDVIENGGLIWVKIKATPYDHFVFMKPKKGFYFVTKASGTDYNYVRNGYILNA